MVGHPRRILRKDEVSVGDAPEEPGKAPEPNSPERDAPLAESGAAERLQRRLDSSLTSCFGTFN